MLWLVLLCCVCACWSWRQCRLTRLTASIPSLPGTLPIIGIAYQAIGNNEHLWNQMEDWVSSVNKLGGIVKFWMGPFLMIGITDSEIALSAMNTYLEKHFLYKFVEEWLGDGLVTSGGAIWKRHRKLLAPAFSQHVIDEFLQIFDQQSQILVEAFRAHAGKGDFDHLPFLSQIALETICQTAVGLPSDKKTVVNKDYAKAMSTFLEMVMKRATSLWFYSDFIYNHSSTKIEATKAADILKTMSAKVIATSKTAKETCNPNGNVQKNVNPRMKPFLELLMELDNEGHLSDTEVREEADTIIAAGYDTTATTLFFLLIVLGSHTEVQERAYREIMNVFPGLKSDVTKEGLSDLLYLEAVIKETLRLYPTIPIIGRQSDRDQHFGDFFIPNGCGIMFSPWGTNRNRKYWGEDAEEYKPERWLNPSSLPQHPAAYMSFSAGRRSCIGKAYAMMSLKTSLVHILRTYRVKADVTKLKLKYEFVLKPVSGHQISIELR